MKRKALPTIGDVVRLVTFWYGNTGHKVVGSWVFQSRAPLAVVLRLAVGRRSFVEWELGRTSLRDTLNDPGPIYGIGDVRMTSTPDRQDSAEPVLSIELRAPSGHCILHGSAKSAQEFLDFTAAMIPMCSDVDSTCHNGNCQEHELIGRWIEDMTKWE